jgi:hypothetical protein
VLSPTPRTERAGKVLPELVSFHMVVRVLCFVTKGAVGMAIEEVKLMMYLACVLMIINLMAGE